VSLRNCEFPARTGAVGTDWGNSLSLCRDTVVSLWSYRGGTFLLQISNEAHVPSVRGA